MFCLNIQSMTLQEACTEALKILKQVMEEKLNATNIEVWTINHAHPSLLHMHRSLILTHSSFMHMRFSQTFVILSRLSLLQNSHTCIILGLALMSFSHVHHSCTCINVANASSSQIIYCNLNIAPSFIALSKMIDLF